VCEDQPKWNVAGSHIRPTNPFIKFEKSEVDQSIADRFVAQAQKHPDRLAVKTKALSLTYAELDKASNRVAHAIQSRCDSCKEPIALLFKQGISLVVAMIGALKTGKPFAPVDYSVPSEKTARILAQLDTSLVVTDASHLSLAQALMPEPSMVLNTDELDCLSDENPGIRISPYDIACIHFTSGSTGEPKGVVTNHRNELHNIMKNTNALHISPEDRITVLRSNNVGAMRDSLLALLNGACLVPLELKEEGLSNLGGWLIEQEVTVFSCVTTIFRHSVKTLTGGELFTKVRLIHVGGEPIFRSDVELFKKYFSDDCLLVNRYSISETPALAYYFIDKNTEVTDERVPVGYLLEGNEVLLLDEDGNDVGLNRVGQIAVKSSYLAVGYWRQPELTRSKFLQDRERENTRIYLTGDLGYMLPGGCLVHAGRKDFQVKIRGYRIELSEIERALLKLPMIKQAAVMVRAALNNSEQLIAYVAFQRDTSVTVHELRRLLQDQLPSYMMPSAFVVLDNLPLTASGKIDRMILADLEERRQTRETPYTEATDPVEMLLTKFWVEAVGVDPIGVHDDFLQLGGDSLVDAQIVSRVNGIFSLRRPLNSLFEAPTIASLATFVKSNELHRGDARRRAELALKVEGMSPEEIVHGLETLRGKRDNG
jgi:amino acid adenylation domain-containing protein